MPKETAEYHRSKVLGLVHDALEEAKIGKILWAIKMGRFGLN